MATSSCLEYYFIIQKCLVFGIRVLQSIDYLDFVVTLMSLSDGIEFLADGVAIGEEHIAFADT